MYHKALDSSKEAHIDSFSEPDSSLSLTFYDCKIIFALKWLIINVAYPYVRSKDDVSSVLRYEAECLQYSCKL